MRLRIVRTATRFPALLDAKQPRPTRWHMFEEKREAVMAIEAAVLPLMPKATARAA
jgi:hypothetical protein